MPCGNLYRQVNRGWGENVRKLLLTEGLVACFFLMLFLGIMGKAIGKERQAERTSAVSDTGKRGLRVYPGRLEEELSPLCQETQAEANVMKLCFSNLLERDEQGRQCNPPVSQKWKKDDDTTAHISAVYDEKKQITQITVQLNPNLKTKKGKVLSADDLLFNYYLRCDASVGGKSFFDGVQILGQKEYTYGTKEIKKRKEELHRLLQAPPKSLQEKLREQIVRKALQKEWNWAESLYQDETYDFISSRYQEPKDLFAYYYAYSTKYSSKGKSAEQVFKEIAEQYQWHTERLEKVTNQSYADQKERLALSQLLSQKGKDKVKEIEGIQKKDRNTISISVKGKSTSIEKVCDIYLLPLSEYGEKRLFDGHGSFGFQKGRADEVLEKAKKRLCGSGAYTEKSRDATELILERNPYYSGGRKAVSRLVVLREGRMDSKEIIRRMLKKKVDIAIMPDSSELKQLLKSRATHASYQIRKKEIRTTQQENCLLYRTDYVNAPSIPENLTESYSIFDAISQLKVNK